MMIPLLSSIYIVGECWWVIDAILSHSQQSTGGKINCYEVFVQKNDVFYYLSMVHGQVPNKKGRMAGGKRTVLSYPV
jgi:hypothetical protein